MKTNVDFIGRGGSVQGDIAMYLQNQGRFDPGQFRPFVGKDGRTYITIYKGGDSSQPTSYQTIPINTNATLRRDEWKQLDDVVLKVAESRLGGVQDLIDNGLTYNLGNAMGTTVLEWHDMSDALEAVLTMDGVTRGKNDTVNYQYNYLPIPIIHVDYEINARMLAASRNLGNPLDTTLAERAARKIMDKQELMLFTNDPYSFGETDSRGRNSIYGYINHPDRIQMTLDDDWDASGLSPEDILDDVIQAKQLSINAHFYGPWMLYIPTAYETVMDNDYNATASGTTLTIRERIMKVGGIKGIKVIDTLPADNIVLVQMTSDVVRLVRGMGIQNVEWQVEGKFITKYKVMTIQVPQLRSDQNGHMGLVHLA